MVPFICAAAGFLLAVLWFDLMFDVQVARHRDRTLPEAVLASIAGYYRRVTTTAAPMNRLVAAVMLALIASIITQIARGDRPHWVAWASLLLAGSAILLAGLRTVPHAVGLGRRTDSAERQSKLARAIYRDHMLCVAAIGSVLVIQLSFT